MTTITQYVVAAGTLGRQADSHDDLAQLLVGFAERAAEHHRGAFLEPLDASQGRAVTALVSAGAALRAIAAECERRAQEIRDFTASVDRWEGDYEDVPETERPSAPVWHGEWSMT